MARVNHPRGGHCGLDATPPRGQHLHRRQPRPAEAPASPAALARSTTGPIASTNTATSLAVEVWPSESRSEPRAARGSKPMAMSTWLGCATSDVQAEPVELSLIH